MKFYNDFLGNDCTPNTVHAFIGGDLEVQFKENASKQSPDWYYHNTEITYSFNNQAHRCMNFEDIDQDNYILYAGCSHTMGVGLELEKTYPYLLSQQLKMDYYNLALPATGIDAVEYNVLTWLAKINKKPRLLVIQWPDPSRFLEYDFLRNNVVERGSFTTDPNHISFIVNAEDTGMFTVRRNMAVKLLTNSTKIPMITFNFGSQKDYGLYDLYMSRIDRARDLGHAGIKSHATFTETLINHIEVNKLIKLAKYNI